MGPPAMSISGYFRMNKETAKASSVRRSQSVRTYAKAAGRDARLDVLGKFDPNITVHPHKTTGMAC